MKIDVSGRELVQRIVPVPGEVRQSGFLSFWFNRFDFDRFDPGKGCFRFIGRGHAGGDGRKAGSRFVQGLLLFFQRFPLPLLFSLLFCQPVVLFVRVLAAGKQVSG